MEKLPDDIKRIIWSFDDTYHKIFINVLKEIQCAKRKIENIIDSYNKSGIYGIYFYEYLYHTQSKEQRDILLNELISYRDKYSVYNTIFPFSEKIWCNHIIGEFKKANNIRIYRNIV